MSKRYQKRRTLTGEPTGKRIRWLTLPGTKGNLSNSVVNKDLDREFKTELVKLNHIFGIYKIGANGLEYVTWTGQIGVCRVKGQLRHCVASNLVIAEFPYEYAIYSMFVPFGMEDETARNYGELITGRMNRPLLQWTPPVGTERGRLQLKSLEKEFVNVAKTLKESE